MCTKAENKNRPKGELFFQQLLKMLKFYNTKQMGNSSQTESIINDCVALCVDLYECDSNYEVLFNRCRDFIISTLRQYNYQPNLPNKRHNTPNALCYLPYPIKILIYTMAYRAIELYDNASDKTKKAVQKAKKKPSQSEILKFIGDPACQGYRLSDKTFTEFGISPNKFYAINNYQQIELPSTYAGAKTGYLGYVINYLVEYAGTIDHFVDLFGGSANASIAVNHTNNVEYHINEIDPTLINYYYVISDKHLYTQYMAELCKIRDLLKGYLDNNTAETQGQVFYMTCKDTLTQWNKAHLQHCLVPCRQGNSIHLLNSAQYHSMPNNDKVDVAIAYTYLHCFPTTGGNSSTGAVTVAKIRKFCGFSEKEFDKFHKKMHRLNTVYSSDILTNNSSLIEYYINKAPKRYKSIERLAESIRKGTTPFNIDSKDNELLRLLGKGKDGKPRLFCTLFYSDSPYLNTAGYQGGGINENQIQTLIERLVNASNNGSHFIFSCRASKSIEDSKFQKLIKIIGNLKDFKELLDPEEIYTDRTYIEEATYKRKDLSAKRYLKDAIKLLAENQSIYQNIFSVFNLYSDKLKRKYYVLVCLEKNRFDKINKDVSFSAALENLMPIEVFITDYDYLCPLDCNDKQRKRNYKFIKYEISEFCKKLDKHMFKSTKTPSIESNSQGNYTLKSSN